MSPPASPVHPLTTRLTREPRALVTIHGDEPLLAQEAADAVRAVARAQGHAERSVFIVSGARADWSEVLAAVASPSLFAERQIVELRLPTGKPGKEGGPVIEQLARAASGGDGTLLLVHLPRLDKATRASAWFGALEKHGLVFEVPTVERAALPVWIAQRLAAQGQKVPQGEEGQHALQLFADRVEGNLLAAHQEVQKLSLLYPPGELSLSAIEGAVVHVARYQAGKLSEALLTGRAERLERMLRGLEAEGETAVFVHYQIAEDIRGLKRVRAAMRGGKPLPMALREQRIWGARERLFERLLPRLSDAQVDAWLLAAHEADGVIKGLAFPGWPRDAWAALRQLALQVCRATA